VAKPTVTISVGSGNQCQKPAGWLGKFVLWNMNSRHSRVTDWGLSHVSIRKNDIILDVGCGGGRTVSKLAAMVADGKVYGIDHSGASVAFAKKVNRARIESGRVAIEEASVPQLPFSDNVFDLVTAVETHFWWPDLPAGMHEVFRVLKPGGTFVIIAEVYKGASTTMARLVEKHAPTSGIKLLSIDEHCELFTKAGYSDIQIDVKPEKGWICGLGRKAWREPPAAQSDA
jgi:ubiquinone/menaquinone biosynthesis C-methylase UbiE